MWKIVEQLVGSIVGKTERIHQSRPQYVADLKRGILPVGNVMARVQVVRAAAEAEKMRQPDGDSSVQRQ